MMRDQKRCNVADCNKPSIKKGYCGAHYKRLYKYGDPLAGSTSKGEPMRWLEANKHHDKAECLKWPFSTGSGGYGVAIMDGVHMNASRAMCILAHGEPKEGSEAAHTCGNGHLGCVNPAHLRWSTPRENAADKYEHGTHIEGSMHLLAKLDERMVTEIRQIYASGGSSQIQLAVDYGYSRTGIGKIVRRESWKHVV